MSLKDKLDELLTNNKIGEAVDLLIDKVKNTDYNLHDTFIQFKSRYTANENANILGTLSNEEYKRTVNQILHGLQQFMCNIPKEIFNQEIKNIIKSNNVTENQINKDIVKMKQNDNSVIKILFMAAQPDDKQRLTSEFDDVRLKLKESITSGVLDFLHPTWETDYEAVLLRLKDDQPNVLHYSGHTTPEGVCLKNKVSGDTQLLENDELSDIFEGKSRYLKLVILNSCFSSIQAEIISKEGIYVLGLKAEIENSMANELAERFYLGFRVQNPPVKIEKAIKIGCKNFAKTYTEHADLISLWKNGIEKDYKSL